MKGRTILILAVIIALLIIIVVWLNKQGRLDQLKTQLGIAQSQKDLIDAQTRQQEECKKNWLCATTSLLGSAADVGTSFGLSGLFSGLGKK